MNEEQTFLDAIRADPTDGALLLVYADWLEERGDPRAEYIRLTQAPQRNEARIEALRREYDAEWTALIDTAGQRIAAEVHAVVERIDRDWLDEKRQIFGRYTPVPNEAPKAHNLAELCALILGSAGLLGFAFLMLVALFLGYGFDEILRVVLPLVVLLIAGFYFGRLCVALPIQLVRMEFRYRRAWRAYQERRALAAGCCYSPLPAKVFPSWQGDAAGRRHRLNIIVAVFLLLAGAFAVFVVTQQ